MTQRPAGVFRLAFYSKKTDLWNKKQGLALGDGLWYANVEKS